MSAYKLALLACVFSLASLKAAVPIPVTESNVYEFELNLTWATSMTYKDSAGINWDVSLDKGELYYTPNLTKVILSKDEVVTLDGAQSTYIAINGQYPGPPIEVPLGALVYVRVLNNLQTDAASIHWHGINMKGSNATGGVATPWADGVSYVTQCPISPGAIFTYKFVADEVGTYWYHSHQGMQKMDGLFGAVIVYDPAKPPPPAFNLVVSDWLHIGATAFASTYTGPKYPAGSYSPIDDRYQDLSTQDPDVLNFPSDSHLINGRGRFGKNTAPLEIHRVEQGQEYLFRIINAGFDDEFEFSIDEHPLTVVGVEGCEIEPFVVDSVFLAVGERMNVMITADQPPGNYWVRYRAPDWLHSPRGFSILSYTNSSEDPVTSSKPCRDDNPCVSVNCPFHKAPGWICIPMHHLNSTSYHAAEVEKIVGNATEYFFAFSSIHHHGINGRSLILPPSNFYQDDYETAGTKCDEELCNNQSCQCTYVQKLPRNHIIQMVITHTVLYPYVHTWHMHGYRFAVLKVVYPVKDNVTGLIHTRYKMDINCTNDFCYDAQWMREELSYVPVHKPPLKDNLLIPNGGYAVIRIYTDNPGYWIAHCHQAAHLHLGMAMVFDVDGASVKDTIPPNFPTCGDFIINPPQ